MVVKRSFVLQRNEIWAKEEIFQAPHGQRIRMESEGEGLGTDLLLEQVSSNFICVVELLDFFLRLQLRLGLKKIFFNK